MGSMQPVFRSQTPLLSHLLHVRKTGANRKSHPMVLVATPILKQCPEVQWGLGSPLRLVVFKMGKFPGSWWGGPRLPHPHRSPTRLPHFSASQAQAPAGRSAPSSGKTAEALGLGLGGYLVLGGMGAQAQAPIPAQPEGGGRCPERQVMEGDRGEEEERPGLLGASRLHSTFPWVQLRAGVSGRGSRDVTCLCTQQALMGD